MNVNVNVLPEIQIQMLKNQPSPSPALPEDLYPALLTAMQEDSPPDYELVRQEGQGEQGPGDAYRATNAAQRLDVRFARGAVHVASQRGETPACSLALSRYGYGEDLEPVPAADMVVDGNRLEYRRGALTEWYINTPLGLEQGFTLAAPPEGKCKRNRGGEPLVLELAVSGCSAPTLDGDGQALTFDTPGGAALRYGHLYVTDAAGRCLPARLTCAMNGVRILVDDAEAIYPIVVDPLFEQTKLIGNDTPGQFSEFGYSAAISDDGKSLLIGAFTSSPQGIDKAGASYIFERSSTPPVWRQVAKLTAGADAHIDYHFGAWVAIDGDTAVVGQNALGKAYIFVRLPSGWPSTPTLTLSPPTGSTGFGNTVAISGDTLVVGSFWDDKAYAYVRNTDGTWPQSPSYTFSGTAGSYEGFGYVAAISGNTGIIGTTGSAQLLGRAYIFVRNADGSWPANGTQIQSSEVALGDGFGTAVAISGNTIIVGAWNSEAGAGKAYSFTRNADSTWPTTESQKLAPSDATTDDSFGMNVAISGNTLVIGAPGKTYNQHVGQGVAYLFSRNGTASAWSQQDTLVESDGAAGDNFGGSAHWHITIAVNGSTVVIGNYISNDVDGAAYLYTLVEQLKTVPDSLLVATAAGSVGRIAHLNSNPIYQALLASPVGLGTAIKLLGDPWLSTRVLVLGSSSIQYCSDITASSPSWQTAVSAGVGETYISDMQGSLTSPGYFGWLSHKLVGGIPYVFYNYTTDFFANTNSIQVARYSANMTYGITLSAYNDGKFWVTAGDPAGGDAGVYPITGGNTLGTKLSSPALSTYGGPLTLPYSLLGGAQNLNDANLTVFTDAATASTNLHTYGAAGSTNILRNVGQLVSNQALNSFVSDGSYLNAAFGMIFIVSNDGGATWTTSSVPAFGRPNPGIQALLSWLANPDFIAIGGTNVFALSTDRGSTWTDLWSILPSSVQASAVVTVMPDPQWLPNLKEPTNTGAADCPVCHFGRILLGNPVEVRHGDKSEMVTDLTIQTAAAPLTFMRSYRQSKQAAYQFMGLGWTHNHRAYLDLSALPTTITLQLSNSGDTRFTLAESNHFVAEPGSLSVIDYNSGTSQYTLTAPDKTRYVFDSSGKLLSRTWPNSEVWSYNYSSGKLSSVTDAYGRGLQLTYISNPGQFNDGQLWRVGDQTATGLGGGSPTGRYVEFGYTPQKNNGVTVGSPKALLANARDVLGNTWTYDYYGQHSGESSAGLLDFLTKRLSPSVDVTGDGVADGSITLEALSYTLEGTTLTNLSQARGALGVGPALVQTDFAFQPGSRNVTTEKVANRTTTHHFFGGVYAGPQDPAGNASLQVNNRQYRPMTQMDANGNVTKLGWSADGKQLNAVNDALGHATAFAYNSGGASADTLDYSLDAEGRKTQYVYGDVGNPRLPTEVKIYDTDGTTVLRWQKFVYDAKGRTRFERTVDTATGTTVQQEVERTYYTSGDGNGLLASVIQKDLVTPANNVTTTYFYDTIGRVKRVNQSLTFGSCTSSFTLYDAAGNVLASICNYDPGTNPDPTTVAEAVALFNPTYPDKNRVTTYAYDTLGRRVSVISDDGASYKQTTLTFYDGLDRVIRTIANYVNQSGGSAESPALWVWSETRARWEKSASDQTAIAHGADNTQNVIADTAYNARGMVRLGRDTLGNVTLFGYDDAGRLVKTVGNASQPGYNNDYTGVSPDPALANYTPGSAQDKDIIVSSQYDPAGNLVKSTDPLGINSFTVYDALNRPVRTVRSAKDAATVSLDPGDTGYTAANDPRSSSYVADPAPDRDLIDTTEYDALGRVVRTTDALGNVTLFGYDALGRQVKTVRNAKQPAYDLAADPDLSDYVADFASSAADQDLVTKTVYDSQGRVLYTVDILFDAVAQNERRTWQVYDGLGRQTKVIQNCSYVSGTPAPEDDAYVGSSAPDEDLITLTNYDSDGRVRWVESLSQVSALKRKTWYVYDSLGRQKKVIQNCTYVSGTPAPEDDAYTGSADSDKDIISKTEYDAQGHVFKVTDDLGNETRYEYATLGRRVKTIVNYVNGVYDPAYPDEDLIETVTYDLAGRVTMSVDAAGNEARFEYDAAGRRVKAIQNYQDGIYDPAFPDRDLISSTAYNRAGQVTTMTDARGTQTAFASDAAGRQRQVTQAANTPLATASYTCYDKGGRMLRTIQNYQPKPDDPAPDARDGNGAFLFAPQTHGLLDDENLIISFTLDKAGRQTQVSDPLGNATLTSYFKDGQLESSTDPEGTVTQFRYDRLRRRILAVTGYQANTEDPALWRWDTGDGRWEQSDGTPIQHGTQNDRNVIVLVTLDKAGHQTSLRDPRGNVTQYSHDLLDRRTGLTDPLSHLWATAYENVGNKTRVTLTDPLTFQTRQDFDRLGRLTGLQFLNETPKNTPDVLFGYDAAGNRVTMNETNDGGATWVRKTAYTYDKARRLTSAGFDKDGNGTLDETVSYEYDAGGLRTKLTLPGALSVMYSYDTKGQLTSLTDWASQKTQYTYDNVSRLTSAERSNGLRSYYKYDAASRLRLLRHTAKSKTLGHFAYEVDKRGNRTQVVEALPRATTGNTVYDKDSTAISYPFGVWSTVGNFRETTNISAILQLLFFGDQATLTMGTGPDHSIYDVYVNYALWQSFDGYAVTAGEQAITIPLDNEGPFILEIRNRPEKNLLSSSYTGYKLRFKSLSANRLYDLQTLKYTYDTISRLVEAKYYPGLNTGILDANLPRRYQYAFDLAGNRTQQIVSISGTPTQTNYTYDAANRLTSGGITYDNAGRMTSDSTNAYTWDRANRLLSMGGVSNLYNGVGQRVQQTVGAQVTQYLLDVQPGLWQVWASTTGANTTRQVFGPLGMQSIQQPGGAWQHVIPDALGSVRGVADANNAILDARLYSPYSEVFGPTGTPQTNYGFTGEPTDGTGLVYLRARYLNPALGVFPSLDPLELGNRYQYVNGNPVSGKDPSGLFRDCAGLSPAATVVCVMENAIEACAGNGPLCYSYFSQFKEILQNTVQSGAASGNPFILSSGMAALLLVAVGGPALLEMAAALLQPLRSKSGVEEATGEADKPGPCPTNYDLITTKPFDGLGDILCNLRVHGGGRYADLFRALTDPGQYDVFFVEGYHGPSRKAAFSPSWGSIAARGGVIHVPNTRTRSWITRGDVLAIFIQETWHAGQYHAGSFINGKFRPTGIFARFGLTSKENCMGSQFSHEKEANWEMFLWMNSTGKPTNFKDLRLVYDAIQAGTIDAFIERIYTNPRWGPALASPHNRPGTGGCYPKCFATCPLYPPVVASYELRDWSPNPQSGGISLTNFECSGIPLTSMV